MNKSEKALEILIRHLENVDLPEEVEKWLIFSVENLVGLQSKANPLAEESDKADGVSEDVSTDFLRCVFDQRLLERETRKWYDPNTTLGDRTGYSRRTMKKGVCAHHTAVNNGFGAWKSQVKKYLSSPDEAMAEFFKRTGYDVFSAGEVARALALGCRYRGEPSVTGNRGVPYHGISAPNSILYLNLPFEYVTWASDGANNDFLGFAWDADSRRQDIDDALAHDLQNEFGTFCELALGEGHPLKARGITCHCSWTNKEHDPGKQYIERVLMPVSQHLGLPMDLDWKDPKAKGAKTLREVLK